ncbi:hypothetical protein [Enterococcus sp. AZ172]
MKHYSYIYSKNMWEKIYEKSAMVIIMSNYPKDDHLVVEERLFLSKK